jgi:Dolichyl-phosphate-mannose-protein mannosyltransferase
MKTFPVLHDSAVRLMKKTSSGPTRWIVISGMLCGTTVFCFYTGHPEWLIRVAVLGMGLFAFFFHAEPATRMLISVGILGVCWFLVFYHLGDGSLYNWDEAIYAEVSKEMLLSRNWASLTWNGVPFLQKPPLQFWLTAFTYKCFGVNEFAVRLWPALFGFGVIALTFLIGARLHSWSAGAAAALILASVDHAYSSYAHNLLSLARVGMLETGFIFWLTLSLLIIWESHSRPWLLAFFGIPLGLAVMTKSWPALFAIIIAGLFSAVGIRSYRNQMKSWTVAAVFAGAIVLPWHLWELWHYKNDFIHEYLTVNLIGRVSSTIQNNFESPFFYLDVISSGLPLWEFVLPAAYLWAMWLAFKKASLTHRFLLIWITVPLLAFSISQTKLSWYIIMIYPALALIVAIALTEWIGSRIALSSVAVIAALCCIRLPLPSDGSPEIKQFANAKTELRMDKAIYTASREFPCDGPGISAYKHNYNGRWVPPALLFYIDRPIKCIEIENVQRDLPFRKSWLVWDRRSDGSLRPVMLYQDADSATSPR